MGRDGTSMLVFLCFFLSGVAGLIYEVLWIRQLSLVFGTTSFAVATVLAAFMAGLALGGFSFGRIADRRGDHLRLYAILEIGIAVYCLLLPLIFQAASGIWVGVYRSLAADFYWMSLVRFAICGLLLLPPATMMGATLPVLSRYVVRNLDRFGSGFGKLYGWNTLGAMIGCFAAGYIFIGTIGVWKTTIVAAVLNVVVALLALRLWKGEGETTYPAAKVKSEGKVPLRALDLALIIGAALAGFASLAYEVAWTRLLALVLGSSVYAFSAMLTTFLLGIALGSMAISAVADRIRNSALAFAIVQACVVAATLLVTPLFDKLPGFFISAFSRLGGSFTSFQVVQFGCCMLVMLLPTLLIGAALPLAAKAFTHRMDQLGRSVGTIYAANTIGAIAGSFLAGFAMLPLLGVQKTILNAAGINLLAGILVLLALPGGKKMGRIVTAVVAIVLFVAGSGLTGKWDRYLLNAGLFDSPGYAVHQIKQKGFHDFIYSYDIRYYEEGTYANVAVSQEENSLFLQINGRTEASTTSDMKNQILVSQIPLLIHPDPKDVLVIGLGSGITYGSVLTHPVSQSECIEISPAVVRAAAYFSDWHGDVTRHPRGNIVLDDGRNYLHSTDRTYDVIISEPSKPWISGVSNLFTKEAYELAQKRLNPRGVLCQWFHYYSMHPDDFKTAVRTFLSVFPYVQFWNADNNVFMVGSNEPMQIDVELVGNRMRRNEVREDLSRIDVTDPYLLLGYYLFSEKEAFDYVGQGPINTDDLPLIEFRAPKNRNVFRHEQIFDDMLSAYPRFSSYPLVGHIRHEGQTVNYDLAKITVRTPVAWQAGAANMVRSVIPAERLGDDDDGIVLGYRLESTMSGQSGEAMAITAFSRTAFSEKKLERTLEVLLQGQLSAGSFEVRNHPARWATYESEGRPVAAITWFCGENNFQYLVRFEGTERGGSPALRDILIEGSKCSHEGDF